MNAWAAAQENGVRVGTMGGGVNTTPPVLAISSAGGQTMGGVPLLPGAALLPADDAGHPAARRRPALRVVRCGIEPGPPPSTPDSSEPARHAHMRMPHKDPRRQRFSPSPRPCTCPRI